MTDEVPEQPGRPDGEGSTRTVVVGGLVILGLAVGWFVLSHFVMDTATSDAIGEAFGVAFALLVVVSVIGAVRSARGSHG
jgi:hypothetical protein